MKQDNLLGYVASTDRMRTVLMVVLLSIGGILEGFGIAVALPVLETITGSAGDEPSAFARRLEAVLGTVGIPATLGSMLAVIVVLYAVRGVLLYGAAVFAGITIASVAKQLRLRLLRAVTQAEWKHTLSYPTGYISNAISNEAGRTAMAYQEFAQVIAEGIQVLVYLTLVFLVSWQTGVAAMAVGAVILLLLHGRVNASQRAGRDQVHVLRAVLARLTDALPSLKPLKAMGREQYLLPLLEEQTHTYYERQKHEIAHTELMKKAREPLLMAALAFGLWAVMRFTLIESTSIMILALLFYRTVTSITNMQQRWVSVAVGDQSFRSLMEHVSQAEGAREQWPSRTPAPRLERGIRLEDVRFTYGQHEVLRGVSADIPAGSFVVLAGPSGGGKSTLTDLVTGLLRPTSGRVLIDGADLSGFDIATWREQIGYVPQEMMLFSDTLISNIRLGRDVSDSEVEDAVRAAGAWDFVQSLPDRLEQKIGEGGIALSGGQRQRVAIARALVARPTLLILDEPTTALDAVTEQEVCNTLGKLRGSLTVLAISHQPAIRGFADTVMVLDKGEVTLLQGGDNVPAGTSAEEHVRA